MAAASLRRRVAERIDLELVPGGGLTWVHRLLIVSILAAGAAAILETEPVVAAGRQALFRALELGFGLLFSVEYLVRLWIAPENPTFAKARHPRLRYVVSLPAIIDLLAIVPTFFAMAGSGSILLRLFRALRILRLAKLGRMSKAWDDLFDAVHSRRAELGLTAALALVLMLFSSTLLYWAEGGVQPDKFGSIPRALWWSVITLTTIGYGDVYPITPFGRLFAAMTALAGVGLVAMPAGILAAAFSDTMERRRRRGEKVD